MTTAEGGVALNALAGGIDPAAPPPKYTKRALSAGGNTHAPLVP